MSMMWNSEGVPPITFLPSGGNGTSSSTSILLQAYPNRDADLAAAPTISLIPALCLLVGPGMPLPNPTCATTLTKADPVPASHALTNTGVTSRDAQQLTLGKSTLNSPATERTDLNRLQALAIPPEDTPKYLSQLTPPTPIDINTLASFLQGHPDPTIVNHLLSGFSQGFKIGYSGPRAPKEYSNLPCANSNPSIIDKNMLKEVTLGHTAGPFCSPPFPNLQVYPIGVIPKKHSSEWRTIFHLSYPKHRSTSVNAHIPPESYSLQYIKVDHAIAILQDLGPGCFMSKLDIKSAFRNVPVHPSDWELLGMKWEGLYFFDMVLPFGLRSAPFLFDEFSSAVEWIIQTKLYIPNVIHILDDFFFATPPPRSKCMTALCQILHLFAELNIPIAPGKTFPACTCLEFMGILLDSNKMEARLPVDKLTRLQATLLQWTTRKSATLQELQSLIGTLQFACKVIAPGRPFLQRIIHLTKGIKFPHWHIRLNSGFRKDISMWQHFLQNWNGVSLFLDTQVTSPPELQLYTDASGSLGYGGFLAGEWFQGHWLPHHTLSQKRGISIEWQELFPIYLACILWGPRWSSKRIRMWCDNKSVVASINSKHSKSPRVMDLIRAITLQTLQYNFAFTASHIPGLDNSIADSLSRFQMDRFRTLAPSASPTASAIPPSAMNI